MSKKEKQFQKLEKYFCIVLFMTQWLCYNETTKGKTHKEKFHIKGAKK